MTVSVETVRMAKSRPRKSQSDLSELHLVTYCYFMSVVVYSSKMAVNKLLHFQKYVANKDYTHEVINTLEEPIIARIIRIHPVAWYSHISMRFELYGCYSGELDEDVHLLEYIFFVNVKFFSHSCIYCVMKYAGWIQLFVVYFLTAY